MDSALYTKKYAATDSGVINLPGYVRWRVLPRYVRRLDNGTHSIDERITVILQDDPNRFWPVIVKMSLEEAEQFQSELAKVIEAKRRGDAP
jgi:hypothetical protein